MNEVPQDIIDAVGKAIDKFLLKHSQSSNYSLWRAHDNTILLMRYKHGMYKNRHYIDMEIPAHTGPELNDALVELLSVIKLLDKSGSKK